MGRTVGMMIVAGLLLMAVTPSADAGLYSRSVTEERFSMSCTETERTSAYSQLSVTYGKGSSVGSSMFIVRCFYDIARERGSSYFFKALEWSETGGPWRYKVYFLNDRSIPLRQLLGDDYSLEAQRLYDELGYQSLQLFAPLFEIQR